MVTNSETIVIDEDSTGRLWATYEGNGKIQVVHLDLGRPRTQWLATPIVISGTVDADDISTDRRLRRRPDRCHCGRTQRLQQVGFRVHLDSDPPATWRPIEVVQTPGFRLRR